MRFSYGSPFQLTPSRRATAGGITLGMLGVFQLTPSRRATVLSANRRQERQISTHALTEGDDFLQSTSTDLNDFNSRPHGGRRKATQTNTGTQTFQLTPSRRATALSHRLSIAQQHFNSRPHGGRPIPRFTLVRLVISTHALTEGDNGSSFKLSRSSNFNSRPHGGRRKYTSPVYSIIISTHALTEGDVATGEYVCMGYDISTHALTEGDHYACPI